MTKPSFLFVKPTSSNGESRPIDQDKPPQYPYDHASWEWLLERALRRTLLPWALTKSHSREILHGHEDQYSMHRWGSSGTSNYADTTPVEYISVGGPSSAYRKTDADLSTDDRTKELPGSWNHKTETFTSFTHKVAYGIVDLEEIVALLPFSLEWLHPDWSSSDLDAWDLTAKTIETTMGSAPPSPNGFNWTWETTVNHIPYTIPNDVPFKCLSHMRTDDPTVTVSITNDDGETIEVKTAPTPMAAPRTEDGSIRKYRGTPVRDAGSGAAYYSGWMLSEFYILHKYGLDYSPSAGSVAYYRGGKTSEDSSTLGCLVDIPDEGSGKIVVYSTTADVAAGFVHEVDWGDKKPTYWHAKGFPKGLDSILSPKMKSQLTALCPMCQPAIPPAVPAFWDKFPGAGSLPWDYSYSSTFLAYYDMYPQYWMWNLALACTLLDMSARLDAMTTTVHRVPTLFAKVKTVTTEYSTERTDTTELDSDGSTSYSWRRSTDRTEVTDEGTSANPIPTGIARTSVSGKGSGVTNSHAFGRNSKRQRTSEESFESNSDFIVCLRSTANTTLSTKNTTKSSTTSESSSDDLSSSETELPYGALPDSYDPDPDDLLFPDWVLPWIETAELFASIESRIMREDAADYNESSYSHIPKEGEITRSYSGSGSGTRTHKTHRKIVSLGEMDISTGRFPAIDAAEILSEVDPDPTDPVRWNGWRSSDYTTTEMTDSNGTTTRSVTVAKGNVDNVRSRSVSYYVVVKWKFDRTDPETLGTESPLAGLYRKLADAKKALSDKERELSDAESSLSSAQSALESAKSALDSAQKQLTNPEGAKADLLEEAQDAVDRANEKLSEAQKEKSEAQSKYNEAESSMQSDERSLQAAQETYNAAVEAGEGVEAAKSALDSAYAAYYEAVEAYNDASSKLSDAEANEAVAQTAADAAKDYSDTLLDKLEEVLQKSVDDAQTAVDKATSRVNEWMQKVKEAGYAIPGLEAAVEAAEKAVRDAGGKVS